MCVLRYLADNQIEALAVCSVLDARYEIEASRSGLMVSWLGGQGLTSEDREAIDATVDEVTIRMLMAKTDRTEDEELELDLRINSFEDWCIRNGMDSCYGEMVKSELGLQFGITDLARDCSSASSREQAELVPRDAVCR